MEIRLAGSFLLLLAWLPAGLAHQISSTMDVAVGLDLFFQCLPQGGLCNSTKVVVFPTAPTNGEKENKVCVEVKMAFAQIVFSGVNSTHGVVCTCRTESTAGTAKNGCKPDSGNDSKPAAANVSMESTFKVFLVNLRVHMKGYRPECLELGTQTRTVALEEGCTNLPSTCTCARINSTAFGCGTQGTVPNRGPVAPQTNFTNGVEAESCGCTGLKFLLCILFGLALGTFLYMPVIGVLLWQRRRDSKGKLTSSQMGEVNQLSMVSEAAPETGTEDLTYSNLKFEKKGTKPTSSDVIYTEIKPSQQKQSGGDAGPAKAGMDVSPEGEGK